MPRPRSALVALGAAFLLLAGSGAASDDDTPAGAEGWQGLLGDRPAPQLGGRWVVVLDAPSLATRVQKAGGRATEAQMKAWTDIAVRAQRRVLARLARRGAPIQPEQSFVRVLNGFSAALDPRLLATLERDRGVAGVYPVRAAYPAEATERSVLATPAFGPATGRRPSITLPGADGAGVTVALLDTGVDRAHPYIRERLTRGIDILEPGATADARQNPTEPGRPERHATELAGLLAGSDGPAGLEGVAPGATIMPIRVAGWQPNAGGGVSVYGRTDQLLAGLEAAVDPNRDGDAHDAAKIALVGLVEPFASFADGPLARAAAGALALDMLVVAPAGNDGPAGPGYGSVGAPAGAPAALGVGATDARSQVPTVHVLLRAGLQVLVAGSQPLGGALAPQGTVDAQVMTLPVKRGTGVDTGDPLDRLFDSLGFSRVAGAAVLLPRGPTSPEIVRDLAASGARAVIVDGIVPAGSLGVDEPVEVPILGVTPETAEQIRETLARGIPVALSVGAASIGENAERGATTPFSSTGLGLAGGPKPELAAPGVGMVTSEPGRTEGGAASYGTLSGTSASAALVAGAAALLADARPDLDAAGLRGALVAGARRRGGQVGSAIGTVDPQAASSVELVAQPAAVAVESLGPSRQTGAGTVTFRNVSRRPLSFRLQPVSAQPGVTVTLSREALSLAPGAAKTVRLTVVAGTLPDAPAAISGAIRAVVRRGGTLRVPWAAAVPVAKPLIANVTLSEKTFAPDDVEPPVLTFTVGRIDGAIDRPQVLPVQRLDVELYRGARRVGTLVRLRDLLPGRYALGVTGRGPGGAVLPAGDYILKLVADPVGGGAPTRVDVRFAVR
jgi:subtilisin family serine protease